MKQLIVMIATVLLGIAIAVVVLGNGGEPVQRRNGQDHKYV